MKSGIKKRVSQLMALLPDSPSIRSFCIENDINYVSLFNCFDSDKIGMKICDSFKTAVPSLNVNWFLYGQGAVFLTHELPIKTIIN